jgi:hypothetical protein
VPGRSLTAFPTTVMLLKRLSSSDFLIRAMLTGSASNAYTCNSLITEFLTPGLRRTGGEPWDYVKQLADEGFTKIFDVDATRVTSAAELKDRYKGLTPREEAS